MPVGCHHRLTCVGAAAQVARHRAEVAAGADDDWRRHRLVDDPLVLAAAERSRRKVLDHTRARALQQEVIELASAHGVADDLVVDGLDGGVCR